MSSATGLDALLAHAGEQWSRLALQASMAAASRRSMPMARHLTNQSSLPCAMPLPHVPPLIVYTVPPLTCLQRPATLISY